MVKKCNLKSAFLRDSNFFEQIIKNKPVFALKHCRDPNFRKKKNQCSKDVSNVIILKEK